MLDYEREDSVDRIIFDYINQAFPVTFGPNYRGPRNVTFGKNKEMKDLAYKLRRNGIQSEEVLKLLLSDRPFGEISDDTYVDFIYRYINLVVPGRDEEVYSEQIDFRDMYFEKVNEIVSKGYGMDVAFRYVVRGEIPIKSIVIVNPKQYVKTNKKSQ